MPLTAEHCWLIWGILWEQQCHFKGHIQTACRIGLGTCSFPYPNPPYILTWRQVNKRGKEGLNKIHTQEKWNSTTEGEFRYWNQPHWDPHCIWQCSACNTATPFLSHQPGQVWQIHSLPFEICPLSNLSEPGLQSGNTGSSSGKTSQISVHDWVFLCINLPHKDKPKRLHLTSLMPDRAAQKRQNSLWGCFSIGPRPGRVAEILWFGWRWPLGYTVLLYRWPYPRLQHEQGNSKLRIWSMGKTFPLERIRLVLHPGLDHPKLQEFLCSSVNYSANNAQSVPVQAFSRSGSENNMPQTQ